MKINNIGKTLKENMPKGTKVKFLQQQKKIQGKKYKIKATKGKRKKDH